MIVIPEWFVVMVVLMGAAHLLSSRFAAPLSSAQNITTTVLVGVAMIAMHLGAGAGVPRHYAFVLVGPLVLQAASALYLEYYRLSADDRLSVAAGGTVGLRVFLQQIMPTYADLSFSKLAMLLPFLALVPGLACIGGVYSRVRRRLGWSAGLIACSALNIGLAQFVWAMTRMGREPMDQQSVVVHIAMVSAALILLTATARRIAQSVDDGPLAGERPV